MKKKLLGWLPWVFLFTFFSYSWFLTFETEQKLEKCSKEVIGFVYKRIDKRKRMPSIYYRFFVEGQLYESSESLPSGIIKNIIVGDSIKIRYFCDDPDVCEFSGK